MKNIYTTIALCFFSFFAVGQSQRTVLVEEFTNASCPPCAAQNPTLNALLDANTDQVVSIKYQTAFPGFDPMNEHNPGEVATRLDYYPGVTGVPTGIIDGLIPDVSPSYPGAPGAFTQQMMDDAAAVPASFDIEVTYELTPSGLTTDVTATCTEASSGDLRMRVVVVEEEIIFSSPPGSTNESEFFSVMKKMLPGPEGLEMASSYAVGETFTTTQTWEYANVYDFNELAVVVFIQNDDNSEVLQAAKASGAEITPENSFDVTSTGVDGISNDECTTTINPVVTIRNNGSETLTSATINYSINDQSGSMEWTGSLEFFESEDVDLGEITFTQESENILEVTISEPNGETDEVPENDLLEAAIDLAGQVTGTEIEVHFYTDFYPGESTWQIRNSANQVVASGGPYEEGPEAFGGGGPDANTTKIDVVSIPNAQDCYSIRVFDSYGDGLQYGPGEGPGGTYGVEVFFEGNSVGFVELGNFGSAATQNGVFAGAAPLSLDESNLEYLNIFPNPSTGLVNLESSLLSSVETTIQVHDITGKMVYQEDLGNLPEGYFFKTINLSQLQSGIYLLNVNSGNSVNTIRLSITN